jgi:hypothetical protein
MAWLDTVFKFIGLARYNTITPALSNGQTSEFQCDASGRLLVNPLSPATSWSDSGAVTSERVVKASAGKLYQVIGRNTGGAAKYLFLFNHAAAGGSRPSNGSTAELFVPIKVDAGQSFSLTIERSRAFATGLYWGVSSTDATFTYDSGGTFAVSAEYE